METKRPTTELQVASSTAIDESRKQQIITLAARAMTKAAQTRESAKFSVETALECGALLLAEKAAIEERYKRQRGFWTEYFNAHFAKHVSFTTAWRWMKMAKLAAEKKTPFENIQRIGVLSLGIMPTKVHPKVPGNRPVPRFPSHLSFINRFDSWLRAFAPAHPGNALTDAERAQLKADFRPVIDFVQTWGLIDPPKPS
jgi:hypothetical protein